MDLSPKKDWLLVLVAAFVIQQIFWGDGWTETNIALLVCLVVAVGTSIFLRTEYGRKLEEKRKEEKRKYEEERAKKKLTPKEERKRDRRELRRLEKEAAREKEEKDGV